MTMPSSVCGLLALLALSIASPVIAFDRKDHFIRGTMIAVYTPMTKDGKGLDLDRIEPYAQFLKARNISNVMPAGSNGESLSLSVQERKSLAEAWADAGVKHGLNIYMHIGSESLTESQELARHAAATNGIKGMLSMTPVYFKPTVKTLHDFMASIAAVAPEFPFWFYHFPDDTGVLPGLAHEFLELADETGDIPNLMGIKYTDYNLMDFSLCLQVANATYNMLYGRDEQAVAALLLGADAAVSSTIGYSPSLRESVSAWFAGDHARALKKQAQNAKLCSFFAAYESKAENVQKGIMKMVGMDVGPSRLPKTDLTAEESASLEKQLRGLQMLDDRALGAPPFPRPSAPNAIQY